MKTYPSQRKFGLPVAIVASAHAILFLGFRTPHRPITTDASPKDSGPTYVMPIDDPVVVDVDNSGTKETNQTQGGDPAPQLPEEPPALPTDFTTIQIPLESTSATPALNPVNYLPTGTIGDRWSKMGPSAVKDLDFVPHALSRMSPIYPTSMKAAGVSGTVTVMFTVDTSGRVADVSVVNATRSEFEEPAMRAVSHWRFEPGKRHGRVTAFRMTIPLNFVLEN